MTKRMVAFLLIGALSLSACGGKSDKADQSSAGEVTEDISSDNQAEAGDTTAGIQDQNLSGEDNDDEIVEPYELEEYEFTKTVFEEDLEQPLKACCFAFDSEEDTRDEYSISQRRTDLHLHLGIMDPSVDWRQVAEEAKADNYYAAGTVYGAYNIQQAFISNEADTARFAVLRCTPFEDGDENDYQYMADLIFTDGTGVGQMDFTYDFDKAYGDGARVEATMTALLAWYGIDYTALEWMDMESKPDEDTVVFEETEMLTWSGEDVTYGPVKTFKMALTNNNGSAVSSIHDTGVTITYELVEKDQGTAEELLAGHIEEMKNMAETLEGHDYASTAIAAAEDGARYCSYSYVDADDNTFHGTYACKDTGIDGFWLDILIYENPVWGYEDGEDAIYEEVIEAFGYGDTDDKGEIEEAASGTEGQAYTLFSLGDDEVAEVVIPAFLTEIDYNRTYINAEDGMSYFAAYMHYGHWTVEQYFDETVKESMDNWEASTDVSFLPVSDAFELTVDGHPAAWKKVRGHDEESDTDIVLYFAAIEAEGGPVGVSLTTMDVAEEDKALFEMLSGIRFTEAS